jgi:hypothetical protein
MESLILLTVAAAFPFNPLIMTLFDLPFLFM